MYRVKDTNGRESPTITSEQLYEYVRSGFVAPNTQVLDEVRSAWFRAAEIPSLAPIFKQSGISFNQISDGGRSLKQSVNPKPKWFYPAIILAGFFILLIILGGGLEDKPSSVAAYVVAEKCVRESLISPTTAQFPWSSDATIIDDGKGAYRIVSHVDSQNGFGAMIRNDWHCNLHYIGHDKWDVTYLNISGRDLIAKSDGDIAQMPGVQ